MGFRGQLIHCAYALEYEEEIESRYEEETKEKIAKEGKT